MKTSTKAATSNVKTTTKRSNTLPVLVPPVQAKPAAAPAVAKTAPVIPARRITPEQLCVRQDSKGHYLSFKLPALRGSRLSRYFQSTAEIRTLWTERREAGFTLRDRKGNRYVVAAK